MYIVNKEKDLFSNKRPVLGEIFAGAGLLKRIQR